MQALFFARVHLGKILIAMPDTDGQDHFRFTSGSGRQRIIEWWNLVFRRPFLLRENGLCDLAQMRIRVPAEFASWGHARVTVVVSPVEFEIEAINHAACIYAKAASDVVMGPHFVPDRVFCSQPSQILN
jgi:hypothetical protein